jgi:CheY-like chemotaxis protein
MMLDSDRDDRYITAEVLAQLGIDVPLQYYAGSIDFFQTLKPSNKPVLILLAYNSHPENGLEVLKKLKVNETYSDIPVVILSETDHPKYREECYRHGASSFIKKPVTAAATSKKIAGFFKYWLEVVEV